MRRSTAKSIAAIALTGAGSALVVGFRTPAPELATTATTSTTDAPTATSSATTDAPTATSGSSGTGESSTSASGTTTTGVATAATFADGTYTGTSVEEPWGAFQVQAVVSGGQLVDVVVVAAPRDGHSSRINSQAVPILTEAVLAAQGTGVDLVSGATWTSESYLASLQSALDAAQAAAENAA